MAIYHIGPHGLQPSRHTVNPSLYDPNPTLCYDKFTVCVRDISAVGCKKENRGIWSKHLKSSQIKITALAVIDAINPVLMFVRPSTKLSSFNEPRGQ